jgi:hypothetical protein
MPPCSWNTHRAQKRSAGRRGFALRDVKKAEQLSGQPEVQTGERLYFEQLAAPPCTNSRLLARGFGKETFARIVDRSSLLALEPSPWCRRYDAGIAAPVAQNMPHHHPEEPPIFPDKKVKSVLCVENFFGGGNIALRRSGSRKNFRVAMSATLEARLLCQKTVTSHRVAVKKYPPGATREQPVRFDHPCHPREGTIAAR